MKPVDIIMWTGENQYTVSSFIKEARKMGVSKRIPRNSIPEGIIPGRSRLLIKHRKAILHGNDLDQLATRLNVGSPYTITLPDDMLTLVMVLEAVEEQDPDIWKQLVEEFELTWSPGVIGYSYISSIQYIVEEGEEELPDDLAHIQYLEPVKMEYENDTS